MMRRRTWLLLFIFLGFVAVIFTQCMGINDKADARGEAYAGANKCVKCHSAIYQSYLQTAHFQTTRPASGHSIHGSFAPGNNRFELSSQSAVVMEKRDSGLYQVSYINGQPNRAERFDISFGGAKAETYVYWKGNQPFELPISYYNSLHSWANSPGYATRVAYFDRPIIQRCFECHTSYISDNTPQNIRMLDRVPEFDKTSLIYGIDCERCHGPAAKHVDFQTANPTVKEAKYITTYKSLTRQQRLDACQVCHGGNKEDFRMSAFNFKMGDTLAKFKEPSFASLNLKPTTIDVHGNQNGLLRASKCFMMSNMDCSTCHDTHKKETQNLAFYSQRCMQCHNAANHNFCKAGPAAISAFKNNCIDCHMPLKPSTAISMVSANGEKKTPYYARSHYIAVYPAVENEKIVAFVNGLKQK